MNKRLNEPDWLAPNSGNGDPSPFTGTVNTHDQVQALMAKRYSFRSGGMWAHPATHPRPDDRESDGFKTF